jgi:hypothetical protein
MPLLLVQSERLQKMLARLRHIEKRSVQLPEAKMAMND